ncbi:hypothetical protein ScPMuIL_014447 [Solemya velum]
MYRVRLCDDGSREFMYRVRLCDDGSREFMYLVRLCDDGSRGFMYRVRLCDDGSRGFMYRVRLCDDGSRGFMYRVRLCDDGSREFMYLVRLCDDGSRGFMYLVRLCDDGSREFMYLVRLCDDGSREFMFCVRLCDDGSREFMYRMYHVRLCDDGSRGFMYHVRLCDDGSREFMYRVRLCDDGSRGFMYCVRLCDDGSREFMYRVISRLCDDGSRGFMYRVISRLCDGGSRGFMYRVRLCDDGSREFMYCVRLCDDGSRGFMYRVRLCDDGSRGFMYLVRLCDDGSRGFMYRVILVNPVTDRIVHVQKNLSCQLEKLKKQGFSESVTCPISGPEGNEICRHMQCLEGRYKRLALWELVNVVEQGELKRALLEEEEDLADNYQATGDKIQQKMKSIENIRKQLSEVDASQLVEVNAKVLELEDLQQKEEQLQLYIEEKQNLIQVGSDKPTPLRSACSELVLNELQEVRIPFKQSVSSHNSQYHGSEGDLPTASSRLSLPTGQDYGSSVSIGSSRFSVDSLEQGIDNEEFDMKTSQKTDKKLSKTARDVTNRLYQPSKAKFEYKPTSKRDKNLPRGRSPKKTDQGPKGRSPDNEKRAVSKKGGLGSSPDRGSVIKGNMLSKSASAKLLHMSSSSLASVPEAASETCEDVDLSSSLNTFQVVRRRNKRHHFPDDDFRRHSEPVGETLASAFEQYTNEMEAASDGSALNSKKSRKHCPPLLRGHSVESDEFCSGEIPVIYVTDIHEAHSEAPVGTATPVTAHAASIECSTAISTDSLSETGIKMECDTKESEGDAIERNIDRVKLGDEVSWTFGEYSRVPVDISPNNLPDKRIADKNKNEMEHMEAGELIEGKTQRINLGEEISWTIGQTSNSPIRVSQTNLSDQTMEDSVLVIPDQSTTTSENIAQGYLTAVSTGSMNEDNTDHASDHQNTSQNNRIAGGNSVGRKIGRANLDDEISWTFGASSNVPITISPNNVPDKTSADKSVIDNEQKAGNGSTEMKTDTFNLGEDILWTVGQNSNAPIKVSSANLPDQTLAGSVLVVSNQNSILPDQNSSNVDSENIAQEHPAAMTTGFVKNSEEHESVHRNKPQAQIENKNSENSNMSGEMCQTKLEEEILMTMNKDTEAQCLQKGNMNTKDSSKITDPSDSDSLYNEDSIEVEIEKTEKISTEPQVLEVTVEKMICTPIESNISTERFESTICKEMPISFRIAPSDDLEVCDFCGVCVNDDQLDCGQQPIENYVLSEQPIKKLERVVGSGDWSSDSISDTAQTTDWTDISCRSDIPAQVPRSHGVVSQNPQASSLPIGQTPQSPLLTFYSPESDEEMLVIDFSAETDKVLASVPCAPAATNQDSTSIVRKYSSDDCFSEDSLDNTGEKTMEPQLIPDGDGEVVVKPCVSVGESPSESLRDSVDDMFAGEMSDMVHENSVQDLCVCVQMFPKVIEMELPSTLAADQEPVFRITPEKAAQISSAHRVARHKTKHRQRTGRDSELTSQFSDDSLLSDGQTKQSARPGSGSRRRRKPQSKHSEVSAKRLKSNSSEEYATSESDNYYSDDSLTRHNDPNHNTRHLETHSSDNCVQTGSSVCERGLEMDVTDTYAGGGTVSPCTTSAEKPSGSAPNFSSENADNVASIATEGYNDFETHPIGQSLRSSCTDFSTNFFSSEEPANFNSNEVPGGVGIQHTTQYSESPQTEASADANRSCVQTSSAGRQLVRQRSGSTQTESSKSDYTEGADNVETKLVRQMSGSTQTESLTSADGTQTEAISIRLVVSPLSVWSSGDDDFHTTLMENHHQVAGGFVHVPEKEARAHRLSLNQLTNGPVDVWANEQFDNNLPASLVLVNEEDSFVMETEVFSPTSTTPTFDQAIVQRTMSRLSSTGEVLEHCQNGTGVLTHNEEMKPLSDELNIQPHFVSSPDNPEKNPTRSNENTPVKYEVTVQENETNILFNVEKTEYRTYGLRGTENNRNVTVPDSIDINLTETRHTQHDDNFQSTVREQVVFQLPGSSEAGNAADSITTNNLYHSSLNSDYNVDRENGHVSRESSVERQLTRESSDSFVQAVPSSRQMVNISHVGPGNDLPVANVDSNRSSQGEELNIDIDRDQEFISVEPLDQEILFPRDEVTATSSPRVPIKCGMEFPGNDEAGCNIESDCTSDYGTIASEGKPDNMTGDSDSSGDVDSLPEVGKVQTTDHNDSLLFPESPRMNPDELVEEKQLLPSVVNEPEQGILSADADLSLIPHSEHVSRHDDNDAAMSDNNTRTECATNVEHNDQTSEVLKFEYIQMNGEIVPLNRDSIVGVAGTNSLRSMGSSDSYKEPLDQLQQNSQEYLRRGSEDCYLTPPELQRQSSESSDYRTPQQSPRFQSTRSTPGSVSGTAVSETMSVEDVEIPDTPTNDIVRNMAFDSEPVTSNGLHSEKPDNVRNSDLQEKNSETSLLINEDHHDANWDEHKPVYSDSLPQRSVGLISNTERTSIPFTEQRNTTLVLRLDTRQLHSETEDSVFSDSFGRDSDRRSGRSYRHFRSLSDSAISSDFTDAESTTMSPGSSRMPETERTITGSSLKHRVDLYGDPVPTLASAYKLTEKPQEITFTKPTVTAMQQVRKEVGLSDYEFDSKIMGKVSSVDQNNGPNIVPPPLSFADKNTEEGRSVNYLLDFNGRDLTAVTMAIRRGRFIRSISLDTLTTHPAFRRLTFSNVLPSNGSPDSNDLKPQAITMDSVKLPLLRIPSKDTKVSKTSIVLSSPETISMQASRPVSWNESGSGQLAPEDRSLSPGEIVAGSESLEELYNDRTGECNGIHGQQMSHSIMPGFMEKYPSLSDLEEGPECKDVPKYRSEGSIDQQGNRLSVEGSNDSITFVFMPRTDAMNGMFGEEQSEEEEPLQHKYGINETFLPVQERSVSSGNIPKQSMTHKQMARPKSLLDMEKMGITDVNEAIFPPPPADGDGSMENDMDEQNIPNTSELMLDEQNKFSPAESDIIMDEDEWRGSDERLGPRNVSLELTEGDTSPEIGYSPEDWQNQDLMYYPILTIDGNQYVAIRPSDNFPLNSSRTEDSYTPDMFVSRGVQASITDTGTQTDHEAVETDAPTVPGLLPPLFSLFRSHSTENLHARGYAPHLQFSDEANNWCDLSALMLETTHLIKNINTKLPGMPHMLGPIGNDRENRVTYQWTDESAQTGNSLLSLNTAGIQTDVGAPDGNPEQTDTSASHNPGNPDSNPEKCAATTQTDQRPLVQGEIYTTDLLPESVERIARDFSIQTEDSGSVTVSETMEMSVESVVDSSLTDDTFGSESDVSDLVLHWEQASSPLSYKRETKYTFPKQLQLRIPNNNIEEIRIASLTEENQVETDQEITDGGEWQKTEHGEKLIETEELKLDTKSTLDILEKDYADSILDKDYLPKTNSSMEVGDVSNQLLSSNTSLSEESSGSFLLSDRSEDNVVITFKLEAQGNMLTQYGPKPKDPEHKQLNQEDIENLHHSLEQSINTGSDVDSAELDNSFSSANTESESTVKSAEFLPDNVGIETKPRSTNGSDIDDVFSDEEMIEDMPMSETAQVENEQNLNISTRVMMSVNEIKTKVVGDWSREVNVSDSEVLSVCENGKPRPSLSKEQSAKLSRSDREILSIEERQVPSQNLAASEMQLQEFTSSKLTNMDACDITEVQVHDVYPENYSKQETLAKSETHSHDTISEPDVNNENKSGNIQILVRQRPRTRNQNHHGSLSIESQGNDTELEPDTRISPGETDIKDKPAESRVVENETELHEFLEDLGYVIIDSEEPTPQPSGETSVIQPEQVTPSFVSRAKTALQEFAEKPKNVVTKIGKDIMKKERPLLSKAEIEQSEFIDENGASPQSAPAQGLINPLLGESETEAHEFIDHTEVEKEHHERERMAPKPTPTLTESEIEKHSFIGNSREVPMSDMHSQTDNKALEESQIASLSEAEIEKYDYVDKNADQGIGGDKLQGSENRIPVLTEAEMEQHEFVDESTGQKLNLENQLRNVEKKVPVLTEAEMEQHEYVDEGMRKKERKLLESEIIIPSSVTPKTVSIYSKLPGVGHGGASASVENQEKKPTSTTSNYSPNRTDLVTSTTGAKIDDDISSAVSDDTEGDVSEFPRPGIVKKRIGAFTEMSMQTELPIELNAQIISAIKASNILTPTTSTDTNKHQGDNDTIFRANLIQQKDDSPNTLDLKKSVVCRRDPSSVSNKKMTACSEAEFQVQQYMPQLTHQNGVISPDSTSHESMLDDFTQTDGANVNQSGYSDFDVMILNQLMKKGEITGSLKEELERLQKERLQIIELMSLNYLPASLTVELLEAKLTYCNGQTDLLLESLDDGLSDFEHTIPQDIQTDVIRDYFKKVDDEVTKSKQYFDQLKTKKSHSPISESPMKTSESGRGRGRTKNRFRDKDLFHLKRRAEIESFKIERLMEQERYDRSRSESPLKETSFCSTSFDEMARNVSPVMSPVKERTSSPNTFALSPHQHKNHLITLRREVVKAVKQEETRKIARRPLSLPSHLTDSLSYSPQISVSVMDDDLDRGMSSYTCKPQTSTPRARVDSGSRTRPTDRGRMLEWPESSRRPPVKSYPQDRAVVAQSIYSERESELLLDEIRLARQHNQREILEARESLKNTKEQIAEYKSDLDVTSFAPDNKRLSRHDEYDSSQSMSHSSFCSYVESMLSDSPVQGQLTGSYELYDEISSFDDDPFRSDMTLTGSVVTNFENRIERTMLKSRPVTSMDIKANLRLQRT